MVIELLDSGSLTNREMLTNVQNAESAQITVNLQNQILPEYKILGKNSRNHIDTTEDVDKCSYYSRVYKRS